MTTYKGGYVSLSVALPRELADKVVEAAKESGKTRNKIMRLAIEHFIRQFFNKEVQR